MIPGLPPGAMPSATNGSGTQSISGGEAKSGNGDFSGGHAGTFSGPTLNKSTNGLDWKMLAAIGGVALMGLIIWKKV
ncbi:hypothetical protein ACFOEK_12215 [Litoribrevibacter euphylliae]|uniref:TMhelix containing protein n=1 Tax=Litoribrevibacter euphylliae TaxID=1834034 RepID=A0ABV7HHA4_9GAMM